MTDTSVRNAEIFVRRCMGATFGQLAKQYGISRARAFNIYARSVDHLVLGLPMTLPACSGSWKRVKAISALRSAA